MPGYVCIHNNSEAYFDDQRIYDLEGFLDGEEGGAISVNLFYKGTSSEIYVPFNSKKCEYFGTESSIAELGNDIELRGVLPFGKAKIETENGTTKISVKPYSKSEIQFKMEREEGYKWQSLIYVKNAFLFLFGWVIILASIFQVWDKIFQED